MNLITFIFMCGSLYSASIYSAEKHAVMELTGSDYIQLSKNKKFKLAIKRQKPDIHKIFIDSKDGVPCV